MTTTTTGTLDKGTPAVKTGDEAMLPPLVLLLLAAAGCAGIAIAMVRRRYAGCEVTKSRR